MQWIKTETIIPRRNGYPSGSRNIPLMKRARGQLMRKITTQADGDHKDKQIYIDYAGNVPGFTPGQLIFASMTDGGNASMFHVAFLLIFHAPIE